MIYLKSKLESSNIYYGKVHFFKSTMGNYCFIDPSLMLFSPVGFMLANTSKENIEVISIFLFIPTCMGN